MDKTGDEFNDFCEQLKQMTEVFDNTLKKYKEKYEKILKEKQERKLSVEEEEELMDVFRILKAYREVDEVPAEMLKSSFSGQIDLVLSQLDALLKK